MRKFIQFLLRGIALDSPLFQSRNKNSHQFNYLICCQRVNCRFLNTKIKLAVPKFLINARNYNKGHKSMRK